jgi:hypothetical protein
MVGQIGQQRCPFAARCMWKMPAMVVQIAATSENDATPAAAVRGLVANRK